MLLIILMMCASWLFTSPGSVDTCTLRVHVEDIPQEKGWIRVALYKNNKLFLKEKGQFTGKSVPVSASNMTIKFEDLPQDEYAIAVYHDINSNFKFDTNFFGVPTEPYGFAKTPPSKWRAPKFVEVGLKINTPDKKVRVGLKKWIEY